MMNWRALLLGFLFAAAWSSAFTSARIVVADAPPFLALTIRFLLSGLIALGIGLALGQRLRLPRRAWGGVVLFGICQNALYLGLNFEAMRTVEAGLASVIASLLPLIVAGLSRVTGEKLNLQGALGLLAGFGGVLIIMAGRLGQGADPFGMMLCFIGVFSLSVATLLVRGVSVSGNLWIVVGLQMLVGSVALLPVSLALETWQVNWTAPMLLAFTYTTLIPGVGATMIWFVLVGMIGATRAATFHFLNPFLGVATAALILGEQVGLRDVLGVAVVMAGILAVQTARR